MTNFNTKLGAIILGGLGALYLIIALASGHSAKAESQPDLSPKSGEAGLDVWKAASLIVRSGDAVKVVDLRDRSAYERYHIPGSLSAPGAGVGKITALKGAQGALLLVTDKDNKARALIAKLLKEQPEARLYYLKDGPRAWYLTFTLPVTMFSDKEAPRGYEAAMKKVRAFMAAPRDKARSASVLEALQTLARLDYQPTLLKKKGRPKSSGKKRKRIAGGCS